MVGMRETAHESTLWFLLIANLLQFCFCKRRCLDLTQGVSLFGLPPAFSTSQNRQAYSLPFGEIAHLDTVCWKLVAHVKHERGETCGSSYIFTG